MSELDESLLSRLARGDTVAAREAVARFGPLVWSLARRHSRTREEAEDAAQEIFVDLLESAVRFDRARGTEAGFVAMIARRRLIDLARRRNVRAIESAETRRGSDPGSTPLDERAIARAMHSDETLEATRALQVIRALPEQEREVLILATLGGSTYSEIASAKGLPLGTIKTYARRGLLRVRAALGHDEAPAPPSKPNAPPARSRKHEVST